MVRSAIEGKKCPREEEWPTVTHLGSARPGCEGDKEGPNVAHQRALLPFFQVRWLIHALAAWFASFERVSWSRVSFEFGCALVPRSLSLSLSFSSHPCSLLLSLSLSLSPPLYASSHQSF